MTPHQLAEIIRRAHAIGERKENQIGIDNYPREWQYMIVAVLEAYAAAQGPIDCDDDDRMERISVLICSLQKVLEQFGDTCVYIRRGGLAWGAVALNRRDDDKKHGVFDLQAQHDRDLEQRAGQVERLIADRNRWMERAMEAEAKESVIPLTQEKPLSVCSRCGGKDPDCYICGTVTASTDRAYDPAFVEKIKCADAAPAEASFDNAKDMLDWLDGPSLPSMNQGGGNNDAADEIARLRKALEEVVRSNPVSGRLESPATRIARAALSRHPMEGK
jgi:hypothetical protein